MSRVLITHDLPIYLELPHTFAYRALFSNDIVALSRVTEHIAMAKHEVIPVSFS